MAKVFGQRKAYIITTHIDWDGNEFSVNNVYLGKEKAQAQLQLMYASEYEEMFISSQRSRDEWTVEVDGRDDNSDENSKPMQSFYIYDNDYRSIYIGITERQIII